MLRTALGFAPDIWAWHRLGRWRRPQATAQGADPCVWSARSEGPLTCVLQMGRGGTRIWRVGVRDQSNSDATVVGCQVDGRVECDIRSYAGRERCGMGVESDARRHRRRQVALATRSVLGSLLLCSRIRLPLRCARQHEQRACESV